MVKAFGCQLEALRQRKGMTATRLAELAGVDRSYLSQVERGRRDPPRAATLGRLIVALSLTQEEEKNLKSIAENQRLLRALNDADVQTPVLSITRELIQQQAFLDGPIYEAVAAFIRSYASSKKSSDFKTQGFSNSMGICSSSNSVELPM